MMGDCHEAMPTVGPYMSTKHKSTTDTVSLFCIKMSFVQLTNLGFKEAYVIQIIKLIAGTVKIQCSVSIVITFARTHALTYVS